MSVKRSAVMRVRNCFEKLKITLPDGTQLPPESFSTETILPPLNTAVGLADCLEKLLTRSAAFPVSDGGPGPIILSGGLAPSAASQALGLS